MTSTFWCAPSSSQPDQTAHFRADFDLATIASMELRHLGVGCYLIWIDGEFLCDGPARFHPDHPEYLTRGFKLEAGSHRIDILANYFGVETRLIHTMSPGLWMELHSDGAVRHLEWRGRRLDRPASDVRLADAVTEPTSGRYGRLSAVRRINPQLGWVELVDTRNEVSVHAADADIAGMQPVVPMTPPLRDPEEAKIRDVLTVPHTPDLIAHGTLKEIYGYDVDDLPVQFFLRDLQVPARGAEGVWRRYDLGRVRLARPRFVIDAPAGAMVEFAACETLMHDRVPPWINFSTGTSCNLARFIARGGPQEYFPIIPLGGRYWEVHVVGAPSAIRFVREEFLERVYFDDPVGSFECDDPLLNRIWTVGVETLKGCSEDALIDNPTRERGQWTGDVTTIGAEIASVAYHDLRIMRRAFVQSAQSIRADGLLSGMHPGEEAYLPTYALHWYEGVMRLHELTGDVELLRELREAGAVNMQLFRSHFGPDGLRDFDWVFIDWGYVRNDGPVGVAFNLFYLSALRQWRRWRTTLGESADADADAHLQEAEALCRRLVLSLLPTMKLKGDGFRFQDAVIAMRLGLVPAADRAAILEAVKHHIRRCFPNDPDAPRMNRFTMADSRLVTPYFMHYCLPLLIEAGEMPFVLGQYHSCWGWALDQGLTTWPEVFDLCPTHCHQWSGCPTWQLSRYVLGLQARFDLGSGTLTFQFFPGDLQWARGVIPVGDGETVSVTWQRNGGCIHWRMRSTAPVLIRLPRGLHPGDEFHGRELELTIQEQ